jgi:hypothetical protein
MGGFFFVGLDTPSSSVDKELDVKRNSRTVIKMFEQVHASVSHFIETSKQTLFLFIIII